MRQRIARLAPAVRADVVGERDSEMPSAGQSARTHMHVSARSDYALRALVELAAAGERPMTREQLANAQHIPVKFLAIILQQLKAAGLVRTHRGADGGYRLARAAAQISLADALRAVDGPLANVRGERPENVVYDGAAEALQRVWIAVRVNLRNVLEHVSLEDVACNRLPSAVEQLVRAPDALASH